MTSTTPVTNMYSPLEIQNQRPTETLPSFSPNQRPSTVLRTQGASSRLLRVDQTTQRSERRPWSTPNQSLSTAWRTRATSLSSLLVIRTSLPLELQPLSSLRRRPSSLLEQGNKFLTPSGEPDKNPFRNALMG